MAKRRNLLLMGPLQDFAAARRVTNEGISQSGVESAGMPIRRFRAEDTAAVVELSAACAKLEADFVLNPLWESEQELRAEFQRHGIEPEQHMLVAEGMSGEILGLSGYLRYPDAREAGLLCPIVAKAERGRGVGGQLLRAALELGKKLELGVATAGLGTRNRAGFALLTALGFRPVRQHFLMRCETRPALAAVPGFVLEDAKPDDAPAIHRLHEECGLAARSEADVQRAFASGSQGFAVARRDGELGAFVELDLHWPQRPWVSFVGVSPAQRDQGLGTALTSWALAQRFDAGAANALLVLSPANRTALRSYEKVGFHLHRVFDVLERPL
jgi:ribosomal protein S18 acetylase RimI-like enzyme